MSPFKLVPNYFRCSFLFFWPCLVSCGILAPCPGIGSESPTVEVGRLNHWITRGVPAHNCLTSVWLSPGLSSCSQCWKMRHVGKCQTLLEKSFLLRKLSCNVRTRQGQCVLGPGLKDGNEVKYAGKEYV